MDLEGNRPVLEPEMNNHSLHELKYTNSRWHLHWV